MPLFSLSGPHRREENTAGHPPEPPDQVPRSAHLCSTQPPHPPASIATPGTVAQDPSRAVPRRTSVRTSSPVREIHPASQGIHTPLQAVTEAQPTPDQTESEDP